MAPLAGFEKKQNIADLWTEPVGGWRCLLSAVGDTYVVELIKESRLLRSERFPSETDAFSVADRWRSEASRARYPISLP
jgi:hypothetical protein